MSNTKTRLKIPIPKLKPTTPSTQLHQLPLDVLVSYFDGYVVEKLIQIEPRLYHKHPTHGQQIIIDYIQSEKMKLRDWLEENGKHFSFEDLDDITELKWLRCANPEPHQRYNTLVNVPSSIGSLKNLTKLAFFSIPNLTNIPSSIGDLINLKTFFIRNSPQVTSIPSSIGHLKKLEELCLYDMLNLRSVPESITNLRLLTLLDLSNNHNLSSIPDSIGNLINLKELYLHRTNLTSVPDSIGDLINLTIFRLHDIPSLLEIPSSISNLTNLRIFFFYNLNLDTIPETFGNLQRLTHLYIYNIPWTIIPDRQIGNLINLEVLGMSLVFESLENLRNLKRLFLPKGLKVNKDLKNNLIANGVTIIHRRLCIFD